MAGINSGDILEVALEGSLHGQRVLSVFHYNVLVDSTTGDYVTAAGAFAGAFKAGTLNPTLAMLAMQAPQYVLDFVKVQRVWPTRDIAVRNVTALPGTNANDTALTNVAFTIEKHGPLANRHNIGSLHIPGVPEFYFTGGKWSGPMLTLADTVATRMKATFIDPVQLTEARMVILNRANPTTSVALSTATPKDTIRVSRRRTVGVGK